MKNFSRIADRSFGALLCGALIFYRWFISPLLGSQCRFAPSCSAYALEAVKVHGAWRGTKFAARRLCRCHPWGGQGYDPVPPSKENSVSHLPECLPR